MKTRALQRLPVHFDRPFEALEDLVDERTVDERRPDGAQEQPGRARGTVFARTIVLGEKVGHQAVAKDEAQRVADPQAAPPHRLEPAIGPHRLDDRAQIGGRLSPDAEGRADHVHRPAPQDGDGRERRLAEGLAQGGHGPVKRAVAAVDGDDRRGRGAEAHRHLVQLLERLGGEHAPVLAEQCLELRRRPGVAPVRARARVQEERDGVQSSPPGASSPPSSSLESPAASAISAVTSAVTSAILGYQRSNTSAIWRACFSFEMLNDDCFR